MKKIRNKTLTETLLEDYEMRKSKSLLREKELEREYRSIQENYRDKFNSLAEKASMQRRKSNFKSKIKESLVKEAVKFIFESSSIVSPHNTKCEIIRNNLINEYVEKDGAENILKDWKGRSYVLSEYYNTINKFTDILFEKAKEEDNFEGLDDKETKDKFYEELDFEDAEDVSDAIRIRVSNSLDEFIQSNNMDKFKLQDTLQKTKEKIDKQSNEELKEAFAFDCKVKMNKIKNRPKNILESMIFNLSEAAYKNDKLSNVYVKDGNLDIDSIVETCVTMYTMLEMLNTAKMKSIDENYILEFIDSIA